MAEGTDFAQQTRAVNVMDDIEINEERRIICYNQLIYNDDILELDEYAGLTLGVVEKENDYHIPTEAKSIYNQASILILDNDSECFS